MSLIIELNPDERARLDAAAKQKGLAPEELVRKILNDHLPPLAVEHASESATLALFRQWAEEDPKRTPEEAEAENRLWEQFLTNLSKTRAGPGVLL